MAVLVTGGSGCIGAYVIRDLLAQNREVINFDFDTGQHILRQVVSQEALGSLISVRGDITDFKHLCRTIKEHKVDEVIHLASWQIPASSANPPQALQIVAGGLVNVLEAARILDLQKVIWTSSIAVYGLPEDYSEPRLPNNAHHRPQSVYGACKSLGEYMLNYYHDQYHVNGIGFRFSAIYGVGRERGKTSFTTEMIRKVANGEPYEVPFGDDTIDWQYVEDVSRLIMRSLEVAHTRNRIFNTQGDYRAVKDAVEYLRTLEPTAELRLLPGEFGIAWEYDTAALQEELGFVPAYNMEQGILKTYNEYRAQIGKPPVSG